MKRSVLTLTIVLLLCISGLPLHVTHPFVSAAANLPTKPNVLFIAVDDLRPELGCYGVKEIKTPKLDALAASGLTFNRAYCQLAVCNPSRVSLLTGLRPDSTKVWDLATRFRHTIPDVVTLPQQFKKHGYYAVSYGKIFHNPWPDNASWSEPHRWPEKSSLWSEEAKQRHATYKDKMRADGRSESAIKRIRPQATEIVDVPDHEHIDGAIAEQALAAMKRLAKQDQPFFLATGFVRPHLPFVVPRKYWELYDSDAIPAAVNPFLPRQAPGFAMNTMYELRDYIDFDQTPAPHQGSLTEGQQRRLKHGYYASVSFIDSLIGRLLAELESLGLAENTIVVLWGDHGWKLGEHNSWCKQTNYEIDARVPLIIRAPGVKANGQTTNALVEFVDIYPTLCELAGLPLPEHLEGRSMTPLLSKPDQTWKQAAFSQFRRQNGSVPLMGYAMRTNRYRYIEWQDRRTRDVVATELYDHMSDSLENTNIAGLAENKSLLAELSRQMWASLPQPPKSVPRGRQRPQARPNIVIFMADDWSWPHAGILGDPVVKTPHFDRVAREGVLFENAFVSTPSCTPSRLSILTGQHHWRLKEGNSLGGSLREEFDVYTEMLQADGYHIGSFGKGVWPSKHAFRHRDSFGPRFRSFDEFIKDRKPGEPFCFWYGGRDPHRPYDYQVGVKSGIDLKDVKVPACLPDNETVRSDIADYLWGVQRFDREVGEIIARLEAMGELDNTIIVVSGDNGMPFPRCKATLYDQGTRVPLAIRWGAKVEAERKVADFVSLCDLAPTFLEAAGLRPSAQMTGRSLIPVLMSKKSGQIDPDRSSVLTGMEQHVYSYPSRALRTKDFLYIRNFDPQEWPTGSVEGHNPEYDFADTPWPKGEGVFSFNIDPSPSKQFLRLHRDDKDTKRFAKLAFSRRPDEELYDLSKDPDQLRNVAGDTSYAKTKQRLRRQLDAELMKSNDPRMAVKGYRNRSVEGWPVRISEELLSNQKEATDAAVELLAAQLKTVAEVLPADALARLRDVPLWLSPVYEGVIPTAEYHTEAEWLRDNGRCPELLDSVQLTNIPILDREIRRMPMMVLHELAHAYHHQVLGFEHPDIKAAYERVVDSGTYKNVRRNTGTTERAYAMTDHKEYFAECTEAFFGTNDFYPFTRHQLRRHDPAMFDLLARLWQDEAAQVSTEWAQYRGHQASGVSDHSATPTHWDVETGKNVLWQTEIPGLGHSAPIVWGERIYVTTAQAETIPKLDISRSGAEDSADDSGVQQWRLLAIDKATGRVVFNHLGHEGKPRVQRHQKSSHCNSTPATDGKHIVAIFGSEGLFCFDMQGRLRWKKDLGPMDSGHYTTPSSQWGFGSSPVIHEGKVVVLCDVQKDSFIAVFDLADGKKIWRTPRSDVCTWSTPTVVQHDGSTQILVNGWHHTGAYDFESGEEIWKLDGGGDIPVPTPITAHGYAYFTSSHGDYRPVRAIRLGAVGDITPSERAGTNEGIVWAHERMGSYMQTPIVVGQYVYACEGHGILSCFDAESGEIRFKKRMGGGAGGFTASPVSDGKHNYFTSETGRVYVIPADGAYSILTTNELVDYCLATPAISEGILIFRTQHKLIAVKEEESVNQ